MTETSIIAKSTLNKNQLKYILEMNNHTLDSIQIGLKNWRNAMVQSHVETGEMTIDEFNTAWENTQKQAQLRINDIEKENGEIYEKLHGGERYDQSK